MKIFVSVQHWKNKKALEILRQKAEVVVADHTATPAELKELVREFDGILIGRLEIINKEILKHSRLKFIGIVAKGVNNIDIDECKRKDISVFYTPEANLIAVAEHVFTFILCSVFAISLQTHACIGNPHLGHISILLISRLFSREH